MAGKWGALEVHSYCYNAITCMALSKMATASAEVFKFCTYISIPIFMTVAIAGQPKNLEALIKNRGYVIYPKEGPRPPTSEEFYEIARKNKERSAQQ